MATPLDDLLFSNLMAAGSADVVVGLPTRNHERTVARVVQTVLSAFEGPLVRERAVLLSIDAGSSDGTPQALSAPATAARAGLRSIHQITTVYAGVPARSAVLKLMLTASDLLHARALIILDPGAESLTTEDVAIWVRSILEHDADYVKPVFARGRLDGPLVTQLLRPLLAASYGFELMEPVDTQLASSGRFAAAALASEFWGHSEAELGVDTFLSALAMSGTYRLRQVATASRGRLSSNGGPSVSEVFEQLVGATLSRLVSDAARWVSVEGVTSVPMDGEVQPCPGEEPSFSVNELLDRFRLGVDALMPLLSAVLPEALLFALGDAAKSERPNLADELWASIVFAFVRAALGGKAPPQRLAQMLEPLYFGRLAWLVLGRMDPLPALLAGAFQNQKSVLASELRQRKEH